MTRSFKELHIFDFDGTLFRNPMPNPKYYTGRELGHLKGEGGWFHLPMSLCPPAVPEKPSPDFWIKPIVDTAKKTIDQEDCYCVLMTGRSTAFTKRVIQLTADAGIPFERYFLKPPGNSTLPWKQSEIRSLIKELSPKHVTIYEDRPPHADKFRTFLQDFGHISSAVVEVSKEEFPDMYLPREVEREVVEAMRAIIGREPPKKKGTSRGTSGKGGKTRLDFPVVTTAINDFIKSDKLEVILNDLNPAERAFAHEVAEAKSLSHKTVERNANGSGAVSLRKRRATSSIDGLVEKTKNMKVT
eukprot:TRINITY_DN4092_c0_g1_i1.p1 TRINITY_DN4092_c0_g1~~TRINITY_DN4092_c0_g1_i1.p1  ORF type:complete len:300 (+),score=33.36 TRINITY_DN4092_c0_g1_i1:214-1113(+)